MYLPLPDILRRGRTFAKSTQDMGKNMKEQIRQEIMESAQCRDLYTELTEYERRGIRIKMNALFLCNILSYKFMSEFFVFFFSMVTKCMPTTKISADSFVFSIT